MSYSAQLHLAVCPCLVLFVQINRVSSWPTVTVRIFHIMASSSGTLKRKHTFLTIETKIEILNRLEKGESGSSLAKEYGVGKATISDIKKMKNTILNFASKLDSDDGSKLRKTTRTAKDSSLEDAVFLWFSQRRSLGEPVSGPLLCEKALYFNEKLGGPADFKASTGWLKNFKSRHGIRELNVQGEVLSSDIPAAETFKTTFLNFVNSSGYAREDVYNCDETGINWKALPRKSLASRRETAAPGFKVSKERITGMVCANAIGDHALPLLIIGKSKKPRCFKNITQLPVTYKAQKSSWMNSEIFTDWYKNVFIPNVKKFRKERKLSGKVLLVMDNAPTHPSVEVLNPIDKGFEVMFLPPNVTPLLQPMDQGVIEKLKRMYRKQVLRRLLLAEDNEESVIQFAKKLNLKDSCYMLADSWDLLTKENLTKAWNKLWPENKDTEEDADENEPETLENVSEVAVLCQSVPGFQECDAADVEEWLDIDRNDMGYEILDDNDIATSVQESENNEGSDSEEEPADDHSVPSHSEAFTALETVMSWYETQPECSQVQLLLLKRMKDLAGNKRVSKLTQPKISDFFNVK